MQPTRDDAWRLLKRYTRNENLIKHAIAVEASMRAYASKFEADQELWGLTGLIHDFDYEKYPDQHPFKGCEILKEEGFPEEVIHAVLAHADYTDVKREKPIDKALFAVDELSGFIVAATLVRPDRDIRKLPVKSVRKRMKDKAFARSVSREDIQQGADELGMELSQHIAFVISAMGTVADQLELAGKQ